jgi:hypothetical protein
MRMLKRSLLGILIVSFSLSSARADCPKTLDLCTRTVTACREALDARNEELKLCHLGLTQVRDQNVMLRTELETANQKLESPLRNPFIMATVGVLIGIAVTGFALK